jgi:hypothetical protein
MGRSCRVQYNAVKDLAEKRQDSTEMGNGRDTSKQIM